MDLRMVIYHDKTQQVTTLLSISQVKANVININEKSREVADTESVTAVWADSEILYPASLSHMVHEASLHYLLGGNTY